AMRWLTPRLRQGTVSGRRLVALSLTALESRCTPASFAGASLLNEFTFSGTGQIPPDTMGAIGPNHVMETVNGAVAIYNKAGVLQGSMVTLNSFFTLTVGGTTYPRNGSTDPRILYDAHTGHWFASCIDINNGSSNNALILAVSRTSDPTGIWDKYV